MNSTPASMLHGEPALQAFREGMSAQAENRALLLGEANDWLLTTPPTVVTKKHYAPSGDRHDYVSIAPYVWPDPTKADGLPWISRDGEVNPVFYSYDNATFEAFCHGTIRLQLAAAATATTVEALAYAQQAGRFLRTWFVDESTRMNPHLRYAQFVPGVHEGSFGGIIDTTSLVFVLDAISRLPFNEEWTPEHLAGVKTWVSDYLDWLLGDFARPEGEMGNNHGTWYDAQVTSFAFFCDRPEVARRQIETATRRRIAKQFAPDGSQPHELRRTLSFTYCTYNLLAFACVGRIAARLGLDLWDATTFEGATLRKGLDWMLPYFAGERIWTHQQLKPFNPGSAVLLLNLAWQATGDPALPPVMVRVTKHPWQAITLSKADLTGRKAPRAAR